MSSTCPVCGFPELSEVPHTKSGGSYEICPSCGFQFGVTDDDRGYTYEAWRQEWIEGGMQWDKGYSEPPVGWDPIEQLRRIGVDATMARVDYREADPATPRTFPEPL